MGKQWIRERGRLDGTKPTKFICSKCGKEFLRKDFIKEHLREDHHGVNKNTL